MGQAKLKPKLLEIIFLQLTQRCPHPENWFLFLLTGIKVKEDALLNVVEEPLILQRKQRCHFEISCQWKLTIEVQAAVHRKMFLNVIYMEAI